MIGKASIKKAWEGCGKGGICQKLFKFPDFRREKKIPSLIQGGSDVFDRYNIFCQIGFKIKDHGSTVFWEAGFGKCLPPPLILGWAALDGKWQIWAIWLFHQNLDLPWPRNFPLELVLLCTLGSPDAHMQQGCSRWTWHIGRAKSGHSLAWSTAMSDLLTG